MTLDDFLLLVEQHISIYDRSSAIRSYRDYCKKYPLGGEEQASQHILQQLPNREMVPLLSVLNNHGTATSISVLRAKKWLHGAGETWEETLCGIYVTTDTAQKLHEFLCTAIPVKRVFESIICNFMDTSPEMLFSEFCKKRGKSLAMIKFHPFCEEQWYWIGDHDALCSLIRKWYMEHSINLPSHIEDCLSVLDAANSLDVKPEKLLQWLWNHDNFYTCVQGKCLIEKNTVAYLCEQWEGVRTVWPMVQRKVAQIPVQARMPVQAELKSWLANNTMDWVLPTGTLPQQLDGVLYTAQPSTAEQAIDDIIDTYPTLPVNCLNEITGLSTKHLKQKIQISTINATPNAKGNWYISKNERQRIAELHEQFLVLDEVVLPVIIETNSLFRLASYSNRANLINYCNTNDWWGVEFADCSKLPMDGRHFGLVIAREHAALLQERLYLWLQGYGKSYADCFRHVIEKYHTRYPRTTQQLSLYECNNHPADKALLDMAYLLFESLSKELHEMCELEITKELIEPFCGEATLASCNLLAAFLAYGGYTQGQYSFARTGGRMDVSAYPLPSYAIMMAHIVNEEVIQEGALIQKAVGNKRYADLWLYVALHMYAAWRRTDYVKMIAPKLPYGPTEILIRIKNNELEPDEKRLIAESFIATNCLALNEPNKTKGTSAVPKLYFFCPRSCLESFGIILAIATAHFLLHPDSKTFINPVKHWTLVKQFFGQEFLLACNNRSFSGRRANKSLLQCIELVGRDGEKISPAVSYYLASIVRSHKLSYGRLSETTDIYLKDATFSGLSPEFVVNQLWERGVCSFVVDVMCKKCYGDQYARLSVSQQTEVIKSIGLSPLQAANALLQIQHAEDYAVAVIQSICLTKESIQCALEQIAIGHGIGKDLDVICLCKAANLECKYKNRLNCMGCKYEIRTKALLLQYVVNHHNLMQIDGLSELEIKRRIYLCKTITYPAIREILLHLEEKTDTAEYSLYRKLIQEVNEHGIAGSCT